MLRPERVPALGIRLSIALLLVVATFPVVALFVADALRQRERSERDAIASLERVARLSAELPEQTLEGARQLLYAVSQAAPELLRGRREECHRLFRRLVDNSDARFHSMGLILPNGDVACNAAPLPRPLNVADRGYFRMAMESGFAVGTFQTGRATGQRGINVAYPVQQEDGTRIAVAFAGIHLERLAQAAGELPLVEGAVLTYADADGVVLAQRPAHDARVGQPIPNPALRDALGNAGTRELLSPDGRQWIYAHRGLWKNPDGRPAIHVIVGLPADTVYAGARDDLMRTLGWVAAGTLAIFVLGLWGIEVMVRRPIQRILRTSTLIGKGDLSARARLVWGPRELLRLGRAFDRMAQSLQDEAARQAKLVHQLNERASTDALTGLANRRRLDEFLAQELSRAARGRAPLAVVMADIDHFKRVNDHHGHDAGDEVLRRTAATFQSSVRDFDLVARLGGEEFVLVMPGLAPDGAMQRAEALRRAVAALAFPFGSVTASFGVAYYPAHGIDGKSLLRAADEALYEAKGAGRDRVVSAPMPSRAGTPD